MPRRHTFIPLTRKRRVAEHMAMVVLALQATLLLTFQVTPSRLPPRLTLLELLWALPQRPTFYPFIAVFLAGPPLTVLACRVPGKHRTWLIVGWIIFLSLLLTFFGDRVSLMLRILEWQFHQSR
ncbi:hypothetical protein ACERK3_02060 [Phycisphaerales bacterium AB-hyl4]|uniref:DUF1705 domain-containing protein n=1 Tax=Natronomicrosphaera hydrolytica TaxID=3242702 RepID=A0ABV4U1M6_9BACT